MKKIFMLSCFLIVCFFLVSCGKENSFSSQNAAFVPTEWGMSLTETCKKLGISTKELSLEEESDESHSYQYEDFVFLDRKCDLRLTFTTKSGLIPKEDMLCEVVIGIKDETHLEKIRTQLEKAFGTPSTEKEGTYFSWKSVETVAESFGNDTSKYQEFIDFYASKMEIEADQRLKESMQKSFEDMPIGGAILTISRENTEETNYCAILRLGGSFDCYLKAFNAQ